MGASEETNHVPKPPEDSNHIEAEERSIETSYVASVDLGTTTIRCLVYDRKARVVGKAHEKITLLYPAPERVEIDPEDLWQKFIKVVKNAISDAKLTAKNICSLGVCTQRASFITWHKDTGQTQHNFITWKDVRADDLVKQWNNSFTMRSIRVVSSVLYKVLRNKRFLAGSVLKLMNIQVNMRLKWVLENIDEVKRLVREDKLLFGTIDTWLIWRLTNGKIHATDYSNASGTALYDPFLEDWNYFFLSVFGIPHNIFPRVQASVSDWGCCPAKLFGAAIPITAVASVSDWGCCPAKLFGAAIPITAVVCDQGASLFGLCGFQRGDVKITLGTGAFLNVNTGSKPHASVKGIYPVHGWKDTDGLVHMAEASSNDNGTVIEWGQLIGLYDSPSETSDLAESAEGPSSVFFIPAFKGIQAPLNDARATAGFIGLTADTSRPHLVKAMLDSLAFRVHQMYTAMYTEADYDLLNIRVDGGVSQNNYLVQTMSTLIGRPVKRPKCTDISALGTAFMAGMGAGLWKSREELFPLLEFDRVFKPQPEKRDELLRQMAEWQRALARFTHWYKDDSASSGQFTNFDTVFVMAIPLIVLLISYVVCS